MSVLFPLAACDRLRMTTDGGGVTTLAVAQGCPLRCRWCINPFSWDGTAKPRMVSAQELYDELKIDELYFIATGGGVTFGGGEPLLHAEFMREFRALCGKEWMLRAETSLNVPEEYIRTAASVLDEWIIDIKDMNPDIYRRYTGRENTQVIENLKLLIKLAGADRIIARVPLIPEYNAEEDIERSVSLLKGMGIMQINCFRYITDRKASK